MKINSLLIGKGSGSAGNVTVTTLKGQTILKQKATIVSNPNTLAQQGTRKMMSRAVYAWQMIGNSVKAGWTSLLPYASQYNTYVSTNASHFASANFTPASFVFQDLLGSQASKGTLGTLAIGVDSNVANASVIYFNKANLNQVAKVGDKLVFVGGASNSDAGGYAEVVVTQAILDMAVPLVTFDAGDLEGGAGLIYTVYCVSADGKKSSTQVFESE